MRVFISWSGRTSQALAQYLRTWLPLVFDHVEPFVSTEDIGKGQNWNDRLSRELGALAFGVVIVTKDNLGSPWLHFEAGALSRALPDLGVCPLLLGVAQHELAGSPLSLLQCTTSERADLLRLVKAMNAARGSGRVPDTALERRFEFAYPELAATIESLLKEARADFAGASTEADALVEQVLKENYVDNSRGFRESMARCRSLDILGFGHNRMASAYAPALKRVLDEGERLRVVAMDPACPAIMDANRRSFSPKANVAARHQHEAGLALLDSLAGGGPRTADIRVIDFQPPFTIYSFDGLGSDGRVYVWVTPWRRPSADRPGFSVSAAESPHWYSFFTRQFEAVWEEGRTWSTSLTTK